MRQRLLWAALAALLVAGPGLTERPSDEDSGRKNEILLSAENKAQQAPVVRGTDPSEITLVSGGAPVTVTLSGSDLDRLDGGYVAASGRPLAGVEVQLDRSTSPNSRRLTIVADSRVLSGGRLELVVTLGRSTVSTPARVIVVTPPPAPADPVVTSPAAGEQLYSGQSHVITWAGVEGAEVKIDLYRGNLHQGTVVELTPNDGSFEWTVPGFMAAANYHLMVRDLSGAYQVVTSPDFAIGPAPVTIEVLTPGAGEQLYSGQSYVITWTGVEGPEVKIDLYRGDLHQGTIVAFTPNDGSFEWTVPSYMAAANYRVLVRDVSDAAQYESSGNFALGPAPILIEFTSPLGGEVWHVGQIYTISWTGVDGPGVRIDLYRGSSPGTISYSTPNDGSEEWQVPPMASASNYRIIIRDLEKPGVFKSSVEFTIAAAVPVVTSPTEGDVVPANSTVTVEWTDFPSDHAVRIEICKPDQSCINLGTKAAGASSHNWVANVTPGAGYHFKVTSTSDPSLSAVSGSFEIVE